MSSGTREELARHVKEVCRWYETDRQRGGAVGQLYRFGRECSAGDYVLYYDPPKKQVVVCRVASESLWRDFDLGEDIDIWHFRRVEYPIEPIPILDFYAALKGRLLGPRMSFWEMRPFEIVDQLVKGNAPHVAAAPDPEIEAA